MTNRKDSKRKEWPIVLHSAERFKYSEKLLSLATD